MTPKEILGITLLIVLLPQLLCSDCVANEIYAGNQYILTTIYNGNYIYQWSASIGDYQDNDGNTFVWIAPDVNLPTEVAISVSVIDKTCKCHSKFDKILTVLPRDETKLKTESSSDDADLAQINKSAELPQILNNNTYESVAAIQAGNDAKLDPASDAQQNASRSANLTSEAVIGADLSSSDKSQNDTETCMNSPENKTDQISSIKVQGTNLATESLPGSDPNANQEEDASARDLTTVEMSPSQEQVTSPQEVADPAKNEIDSSDTAGDLSVTENPKAADQSLADETCTLSFGDGVEVDVVFEQSNSLADTAYVIIQEAVKEVIGSGSSSDGTNTPASLTNTTIVPESGIDQSDANINQTKEANALPEIMAGSTGKTDETQEQSNTLEIGSEIAAASPDPNENPPEQAINQTGIGIN